MNRRLESPAPGSWETLEVPTEARPLPLDLCLRSGQTFSWKRQGEAWVGSHGAVAFALRQEGNAIRFVSSVGADEARARLADYLALDENPADVLAAWRDDPVILGPARELDGLRILRQDPWECLAGFILSSVKQIPHIEALRAKLCARWGRRVRLGLPDAADGPESVRGNPADPYRSPVESTSPPEVALFPSPEVIAGASEGELRALGMGFRAPSLLAAAREVAEGNLDVAALAGYPLDAARERLLRLRGVGPKIADCVLLFGARHGEAFPVDVWIERALRQLFFRGRRLPPPPRLRAFLGARFGVRAGLAQQVLFLHARDHPELFRKRTRPQRKLAHRRKKD